MLVEGYYANFTPLGKPACRSNRPSPGHSFPRPHLQGCFAEGPLFIAIPFATRKKLCCLTFQLDVTFGLQRPLQKRVHSVTCGTRAAGRLDFACNGTVE